MTTTTKERPILFSGEMVRAILGGHKTQTRRVVKPQPHAGARWGLQGWEDGHGCALRNPYGQPGDLLWVRETWAYNEAQGTIYAADGDTPDPDDNDGPERCRGRWRPSIHMPRWASRITLEVVSVRVERVQSITHEDALAEGIEDAEPGADLRIAGLPYSFARTRFCLLWNSINAARGYSWEVNPWVWVVEFRRTQP